MAKRTAELTAGDSEQVSRSVESNVGRDEDEFVAPDAWLRFAFARRGGVGVRKRPVPAAVLERADAIVQQHAEAVRASLDADGSDADVAAAGRAYLDDPANGSPLGAAAVTLRVINGLGWGERGNATLLGDRLLARHGVRFAAETALLVTRLELGADDYGNVKGPGLVRWSPPDAKLSMSWQEAGDQMMAFGRVRAALAAADDEQYAEVVAMLAQHRKEAQHCKETVHHKEAGSHPPGLRQRITTSFLAPTQAEWVEADYVEAAAAADDRLAVMPLCSVTTVAAAKQLLAHITQWLVLSTPSVLYTLCVTLGSDFAQVLVDWLVQGNLDASDSKRLLGVLSVMPTDEAFQSMVDRVDDKYVGPAVVEASARFPRRALRLLAAASPGRAVDALLRSHVARHPDLAKAMLPQLPAESAARVQALVEATAGVPEARAEDLPAVLVSPPWTVKRAARRPVTVEGLVCTDEPTVEWAPGEREEWQQTYYWATESQAVLSADWEQQAAKLRAGELTGYQVPGFFLCAPEAMALPLLGGWHADDHDGEKWGRRLAARFGAAALAPLLSAARYRKDSLPAMCPVLLPFTGPAVAVLMADLYSRLKRLQPSALTWLTRHPRSASRALVPPALGPAGADRRSAEAALRALASAGHRDEVLRAAGEYGAEALDAVTALVDVDPLEVDPGKVPAVPSWAQAASLPRVLLRDGRGALPVGAVQHLITVLMLLKRGEPHAGLAAVRAACEPHTLGELAWALFQGWQSAGTPPKESWAFDALALIGDDEVVRRLAPVIRAWPGEGGHARAVIGLDILAAIGTDVALMQLNGIAQKVKFTGLKERAVEKVTEVAAKLGLTRDQLADRLVPDFGLDPSGSLTLDFGPRQFVVGFDEQLKPFVTDGAGQRRPGLPKPAAKDDADLAAESVRRFAGLKKDVRTVAADQLHRLEQAMVTGRRWTGAEFRQYFVAHPLLWYVVRRLVWARFDQTDHNTATGALRVAEDRSFADVHDKPVELADDAVVGVAHPLHLGDDLPAWLELFTDYEIGQPFPQLRRPAFRLDPHSAADRITSYQGRDVLTTKLLGLERRGWNRGPILDAGIYSSIDRGLAGERSVEIELNPGIAINSIDLDPTQILEGIAIRGTHRATRGQTLTEHTAALDPVTVSELIRELEDLVT